MISAGIFNRRAASRSASTLGASYRQYVFLSTLRKENSHWILISVFTRVRALL